jgi:serine/threonine-protein kinase HipA
MAAALNVWMNGELVGVWYTTRTGTPAFRYEERWVQSDNARPLSLSLPITAGDRELRGEVVSNYFDNLLPDSPEIRRRLRTRFRTRSTAPFDLLAAIGRDCVGAVQLLPPEQSPEGWNRIDSTPLGDADIERLLGSVTSETALSQGDEGIDDFRISIAGAQEKTALLRIDGAWHRPHGATPTTHILKLPLGLVGNMRADMRDSVDNEWLCARIISELGLPMANTEIARFGTQKVLVVERFDRRWVKGAAPTADWIARLPQEDLCQASGTPPTGKYESDGGPGIGDCLGLLAASAQADSDRRRFVLMQLAFWLLAATDGHAKNFSIFLSRGGTFRLTPAYDVLSAWPIIGDGANQLSLHKARLAMALRGHNAHYRLLDIQPRHWRALADSCGVAEMWPAMLALAEAVDATLERVAEQLPADFPAEVWQAIAGGMRRQAAGFLDNAQS